MGFFHFYEKSLRGDFQEPMAYVFAAPNNNKKTNKKLHGTFSFVQWPKMGRIS